MVREQEPARTPLKMSQPRTSISQAQEARDQKNMTDLSPTSIQPPSVSASAQLISPNPEFGRPTPLNNNASPLAKTSTASTEVKKIRKSADSSAMFAKRRPGELPGLHKPPSAANPLSNLGRDVQKAREQPRPNGSTSESARSSTSFPSGSNDIRFQRPTVNPVSRSGPSFPTFSSNDNTNPYYKPTNDFIDLTKPSSQSTDDGGFNDSHVFGNDRFGTADPMMYVDSKAAGEDIKALLEGAMDEEDGRPRTRRRKKELEKKVDDLSKQLQGLGVNGSEQQAQEDEEELDDGSREGLKVKLLPHQIDGVDWMINKESGSKKVKGMLPHGGILADDMGLGKTIQSIALILSNPRPSDEAFQATKKQKKADMNNLVMPDSATLVVAPLALIKQWEGELRNRIEESHKLNVIVHHGPSRTKSYRDLRKADVVITTYQTLTSEHGEDGPDRRSALFGVKWWRILLDEAHSIKNRNAKSTKAACALTAEYRWCLTGTPLQNNLDELQSLINFLRIRPYCDLKTWKDQITTPLNNGRGGLAFRRLRAFLSAFMKRRTKDVLKKEGGLGGTGDAKKSDTGFKLVKRTVENVVAEFSPAEREAYRRLEDRTDKSLELLMAGEQASYASVLVLLMRMRQACNHYSLLGKDLAGEQDLAKGSQTPRRKARADDMDDIANMLGGLSVETRRCDVCQLELTAKNIAAEQIRCDECEADQAIFRVARKSSKEKKKQKVIKERKVARRVILDSDDEDEPALPHESGSDVEKETDEADTESDDADEYGFGQPVETPVSSTKIRHLLKILKHDSHTNKYIVFSFFTSMLDLIEPFLRRHGLKYVRYDGKMRNDAREASLESLRSDPDVRILLCSLRAGSLGLNLTAASRVVILEPFWNPFVEEQAIDRVHRLNQTQDVIVHKLTINNSVESRILELQEQKRELAKQTIEGEKATGAGKLTMAEMLKLFHRDAESTAKVDMLGLKDGRSLLAYDDDEGAAAEGIRFDDVSAHPSNRMKKQISKGRRAEDPIYGRRW